MKFLCYSDWAQLPPSAEALFAEGDAKSMFCSRPWFENLTETALDDNQTLALASVIDDNRMLALLPLLQSPNGSYEALCHRYSSLYSPLLTAGSHQAEILACLAEGLRRLPVDALYLHPFDKDDPNMAGLQRALNIHGFSCHSGFRFFNWVYPVAGKSFNAYMAERPARLRNTIARKARKLEREHHSDIRLYTDTDFKQGLADYAAVYNASWKAKEGYPALIEGLVEQFSALGWLRLAVLYIDHQPAAAQLWFVVNGKASIFRLAYDEAWARYSPGSILTKYLMEQVIDDDNVTEIDFLTGNERYKQEWMSIRRERWGMICTRMREKDKQEQLVTTPLRRLLQALKNLR